jgi:hypothetical protein
MTISIGWRGCEEAHSVAHMTPVQEDLGSILTQTHMAFLEYSHLPSFRQQTGTLLHSFVILWRQVEKNNIIFIIKSNPFSTEWDYVGLRMGLAKTA